MKIKLGASRNDAGLAALDEEFNAADSQMPLDEFVTRRNALINSGVQARKTDGDEEVTKVYVRNELQRAGEFIIYRMMAELAKVQHRMGEIEAAVAEGPPLASAIDKLQKTLAAPVRPQYNEAGQIVGAVRDVPADDTAIRLAQAEVRIANLVAKPSLVYKGVWRDGVQYQAGNVTTDHGSMWTTDRTTTARPGQPDSGWVLCIKGAR